MTNGGGIVKQVVLTGCDNGQWEGPAQAPAVALRLCRKIVLLFLGKKVFITRINGLGIPAALPPPALTNGGADASAACRRCAGLIA